MTRSLSSAISGIDASQSMLDNIGNNIANVNTNGYQSTSMQFADLMYQQLQNAGAPTLGVTGGTNPVTIGTGVYTSSVGTSFSQGVITQTGVSTNLAIQGSGFFIANQNGSTYYTRAGDFQLDADGQLVSPSGAIVQGWLPNASGVINTAQPMQDITIPQGQASNPNQTTELTMGGNLPVWNGTGTAPSYVATATAFDATGGPIPLTVTFTAQGGNVWGVVVTAPKPGGGTDTLTSTTTPPTISFSAATGQMVSTAPITLTGFTGYTNLSAGAATTMNLDFPTAGTPSAVTQFSTTSSVQVSSQDGYTSGTLDGYSFGADGTVTGNYSNGRTQILGQIGLANFANPEGLNKTGNLLYQASTNSGIPHLGVPGTGGLGTIVGGSVEGSNVDLGSQLTDLIVAQTAYQANTKVVSTTSTVLQSLVQMA